MSGSRPVFLVIESLTVGGAERVVVELANRLDRARWTPHVVCLTQPGPLADAVKDAPVHALGKRRGIDLRLPGKLRALADEVRPALACSHLWTANAWTRFSLRDRMPVLPVEHNRDDWKTFWQRGIDRWLARTTPAVIAVSEDAAACQRDSNGLPSERVRVIRNGVDCDALARGERWRLRSEFGLGDAPLIGVVARFVPQKNLLRWLDALARVVQKHPNVRGLLAGDGPEYAALAARAAQPDLAGKVVFAGLRNDADDVYAALDLFVLSSDREGHPVAALEAQAAGVPVVLTDVGGAREAIARDGEKSGGLAVSPTAEALAEGILSYLNDPEKRTTAGAFARNHARRHFDVAAMADAYDKLFQEFAPA